MTEDTILHTPNEVPKCQIAAYWRLLAQRNQWMLIDDVDTWLDRVLRDLHKNNWIRQDIKIVLLRAYSARLYEGLRKREERAANELWFICYRQSIKRGQQHSDAEELAQEVLVQVLEKLPALRSPESLIPYALMILRTVSHVRRSYTAATEASLDTLIATSMDFEDCGTNLADEVEQKMFSTELIEWLHSKLPNTMEQMVLLRILLFDDRPRDIAQELNLPLYRTRIAKHRALKRLRDDDDFMQLLQEVARNI